jgi:Flp pilus assembly protein TadB
VIDAAPLAAGMLTASAITIRGGMGVERSRVRHATAGFRPSDWQASETRERKPVLARRLGALAVGVSLALVVPLPWGAAAGVVAFAAVLRVLGSRESADALRSRQRMTADLPLGVDLLASSLAAGAAPAAAIGLVGDAVRGRIGDRLRVIAETLDVGVDPLVVWDLLASDDVFAPVARALARSARAGVPAVPALQRVAFELRAARRAAADQAAQVVAVKAVAPIGLCFLPAFVLLGIVPTVWGLGLQALTGN